GCTGGANQAVVIQAPEISLFNPAPTAPALEQVCGNNDSFIDPGERWRVPVTVQNSGFVDATNAYAVFTKNANSNSFEVVASDAFGNTLGSCGKQFIDISTTGAALTLIDSNPNDNFPANDDGVATVNLTQPFNLYGQTISSLYLSTNGYISTDPNEDGSDFDNDCPLPATPNRGSTQARIVPLHNDLIVQNIYHQHFTSCPRPASSDEDLACDVFMYSGVDLFSAEDSTVENFNFEAILYPETGLWVYQYEGDGISPASTIGLQNNNATDGAHYSCGSSTPINTQQAVCVYHGNFPESSGGDVSKLYLETPVIAFGDMPVSEQRSDFLTFSVDESAQCGSPIGIEMQAVVYESGFNQDDSIILSTELGNNGSCSVANNCSVNGGNSIQPTNGLWWNSNRSGNGNDMYFLDREDHPSDPTDAISAPNELLYVQYTALEDRSPIWYITGTDSYYQNNQAYNNLNKHEYNGPFLTSTRTITQVGTSHTTLIDANTAVQTRTINGEFSADLIQSFIFGSAVTPEQRTGLWFNPAESGWGATIGTQGDTEVVVNYLFDNSGQPYWVLGSGDNVDVEDIDMDYINAFCPHCPITPLAIEKVGSVRINYDSSNASAILENMSIEVENEQHNGQWDRTNLPLSLLTPALD
ncbi:MAG: hypothetical protein L3J83_01175, partial [Proteobacteria bacterium]|nr:hypothetical protein [Pseudomonadota bacterium]